MSSPPDRCLGPRRGRRSVDPLLALVSLLATVALGIAGAKPARAVPIDDPQVGGIGFSGPTTGDLAAIYWNPAALGLMHGVNVTFAGTGQLSTTTVSRTAINANGQPGGGASMPVAKASPRAHPFVWPPGPGAFAGISYDVGGDRLTLAAAVYMPFLDRTTYQTSGAATPDTLATRYHRISADLRNLALVPAFAVRLAGDFRLGFAPGVLLSTGRMSFAESTCSSANPCTTAEDPATDAQVDIGSNQGIFSSKAAVTLTTGLYFRRRAWQFGVSFASRPLGGDVGGAAVIVGDQSSVRRAPRDVNETSPALVSCDNQRADGRGCVFADIVYKLPYILTGAVSWNPRPGLELTALGRILSFPANDVIDIRLTGAALADTGVPAHIVLHRGYGTVVDTRLRFAAWIREWIRVGAGLRFESGALPLRSVSPATVDNQKFQPTAMLLIRPVRHLWIAAGYGFTYMLPVNNDTSAFDPTAARDCALAGGDLGPGTPSCQLRKEGLARGTAAGSYRHYAHDFSLSMTAQF